MAEECINPNNGSRKTAKITAKNFKSSTDVKGHMKPIKQQWHECEG
jgi:hypothetical protein